MKGLWAGLALLMSISSAQACALINLFDPSYSIKADFALVGTITKYQLIPQETVRGTHSYPLFWVTPKRSIKGELPEPFWAVWSIPTNQPTPSTHIEGPFLMAFKEKGRLLNNSDVKAHLPKTMGSNLFELFQQSCSEASIFSPHSPKAQAIIEVLGKQAEAEQ